MTEKVESALRFVTTDVPSDPVVFEIDGEHFNARPWMTGAAFLRYSVLLAKGGLISQGTVEDFFADVMEPAEHERFRKFIEDPDRRVTVRLLGDIFLGLFARYGAGPEEETRPTKPSGPSPSGPDGTSDGSEEKPPSEELP